MVLDASGAIEFLLNTARGRKVGARLPDDAAEDGMRRVRWEDLRPAYDPSRSFR